MTGMISTAAAAALLLYALSGWAQDVPDKGEAMSLSRKGNCASCHGDDAKLVGPSWKAIGDKYRNVPDAGAVIAANIRSGGTFGWKIGVMPARGGSGISDREIDRLAKYIAARR